MLNNLSIRHKLTAIILGITVTSLVAASAILAAYDFSAQSVVLREEMDTLVGVVGQSSIPALSFDDPKAAGDLLSSLAARPSIDFAVLLDVERKPFADYTRVGLESRGLRILPEAPGAYFTSARLSYLGEIRDGGSIEGFLYLESSLTPLFARARRFFAVVGGTLAIVMFLATLLTLRLQRVVSKPILALAATAEEVSRTNNYSLRAERSSSDETGVLIDGFNAMLERVQERDRELDSHRAQLRADVATRKAELQELFEVMWRQARDGDLSLRAPEGSTTEVGQIAKRYNILINSLQQASEALAQERASLKSEIRVRKRAEAELTRFAQRLQSSNTELAEFAYVASHDLQEPLRKVQAFGDRLKRVCAESLDETGRDYINRMQNASARMQSLINDLLAFSRLTNQQARFVDVDLDVVAREVLVDLEVRIEELNATVEVAPLGTVQADPTQMKQLIQNLTGNALKFHREGVDPVVRISCVRERTPECASETFRLIVEDNGIGFEQKYADKIFGMFQRLHGRETYEGTGVGLALCRKISERHGGGIRAESEPGVGTRFIVTLETEHQQQPDAETDDPASLPLANGVPA